MKVIRDLLNKLLALIQVADQAKRKRGLKRVVDMHIDLVAASIEKGKQLNPIVCHF